jgi:seryl-tRNA synthetase
MLDPKLIREDPDNIKKNLARRRDPKLETMVDDFIDVDETK